MKKYFTLFIGLLLIAGCHPQSIGGKQISEKSRNYYKGWFGYYYSPGNNTFELGFHPLDVDEQSFEVLGKYHAKDKNHVFYEYKTIEADPASFISLCDYVGKDKNQVFDEDKKIEKADPASFAITNTKVLYDKNHVFIKDYDEEHGNYYRPSKIKMDIASVEELYPQDGCAVGYLLRDKNGVYAKDIKQDVTDPATFRRSDIRPSLGPSLLWEDKDDFYSLEWDPKKKMDVLRRVGKKEKMEIIKQYQKEMEEEAEFIKKTGMTIEHH